MTKEEKIAVGMAASLGGMLLEGVRNGGDGRRAVIRANLIISKGGFSEKDANIVLDVLDQWDKETA